MITARLFVYGSCLCALLLLIAQLASQTYLRAHERRLLVAMPTSKPAPPLLVAANSGASTLIRPSGTAAAASAVGPPTATPTYTSTTSDGYSAALAAATAAAGKSKQVGAACELAANNNGNASSSQANDEAADEQATTLDSNTNFNDYSNEFNHCDNWLNGNKLVPSSNHCHEPYLSDDELMFQCSSKISLKIPINLLIQLIATQLLIVLLIESQSLLGSWRKRALVAQQTRAHLLFQLDTSLAAGGGGGLEPQDAITNPIGPLTYALVWALIYLQATLAFWLLGRFVQLATLALASASSGKVAASKSSARPSSLAANGKHPYVVVEPRPPLLNNTHSAAAAQSSLGQANDVHVYNQQQQQRQYQAAGILAGAAAISPASSSSYGALTSASSNAMAAAAQQQQQQQPQLPPPPPQSIYLCNNNVGRCYSASSKALATTTTTTTSSLVAVCQSDAFRWILVHAMPAIASSVIVWLACDREAAWINASAYTLNGYFAQLAYWPLLVDACIGPLGSLLYSMPTVSECYNDSPSG